MAGIEELLGSPLYGVDSFPLSNVYPGAGSNGTLGQKASALSRSTTQTTAMTASVVSSVPTGAKDVTPGRYAPLGRPFAWWGLLAILLALLMFGSRKLGTGEEFRQIKPSVFNLMTIGLAAVIAIPIYKVLGEKARPYAPAFADLMQSV